MVRAAWYPPETVDYTIERQREIYDRMCREFFAGYPEGVTAETMAIEASGRFKSPIQTQIADAGPFYPAEDYHQEYWEGEGQRNPYCLAVIPPKLMKLRKSFQDKVKA